MNIVCFLQQLFSMKLLHTSIAFVASTFGKGYLAPIDYLALTLIVILALVISIGLYYALIGSWIRDMKHPLNLRLIFIGLAVVLIMMGGYTYLLYVFVSPVPLSRIFWPLIIIFLIWIIYTILVSIFGKKVTRI
jgi:hypothetical protein